MHLTRCSVTKHTYSSYRRVVVGAAHPWNNKYCSNRLFRLGYESQLRKSSHVFIFPKPSPVSKLYTGTPLRNRRCVLEIVKTVGKKVDAHELEITKTHDKTYRVEFGAAAR